ncbi:3'5'-cyclic nucleotide phosphodiesterase family protein [Histomonas meleagridis]|uniref:3'5'-cyclic nucleotide phosphodiesterase family protein n=1 Tax=Histomonas meleagridis TaxID=135588 RepID=UPI00355AA882|nr:3'5'-cyclic nucleotide phosphodiesterase family protein [Histomonas meleagridis]KAH0798750.1 3'5'-cyclic nucleotide phosphodiesterase family protein [Histomonas meleagridis]
MALFRKEEMADPSSQLSSFLKAFAGRSAKSDAPEPAADGAPNVTTTNDSKFIDFNENSIIDTAIYGDGDQSNASQMQIAHLESILKLKNQQIERLQAEVRTLTRIQNDQAIALEMALQDRRELERQLATSQTGISAIKPSTPNDESLSQLQTRPGSAIIQSKETPYFLENSLFLRAFLHHDYSALDELIKSIQSIADQHTRGLAGQALFSQFQRYMQLNSFYERLSDESGTDSFINTFETNVHNLIDCRRILLWSPVASAHVIVSRTASMLIPEGEGLLGKVMNEGQRIVITDPSRDPSYSMDYDGPLLSNARVTLYQPVVNSKKEILWIIQIIDRLNTKGSVVTPTGDDFLLLDFLSLSLLKLSQEESRIDEMIKRIMTESTRSLLTERQIMPLLETVQLTITRIVDCDSIQIFFADQNNQKLFHIKEDLHNKGNDINSEMNLSRVIREEFSIEDSGIAGVAYTSKKVINVPVAKEHPSYKENIDGGEFKNGPLIAVPLLSSKGTISLVAVARRKQNGSMFTESDEIILEALSRVSQGALNNAQAHERNVAEIQKALNNHKYYTALLAVAQELSAVLDTDTLVRKIMTKAQSFIGADRCSLFLVDKVHGGLWSMVAHGANDRIHVPLGEGIAGHVASTGETLNITDAYNDPRFNSAVDNATGYRTHSILCVPIRSGDGNIIGCTQMINKLGASQFSSTDVELMTAFNVFCGIALSNAQLFEAATQGKKKMTAMLDIALSLSTSPSFEAFVTNIIQRARELIEADYCWFFVHDKIHQTCKAIDESSSEFTSKNYAIGYVTITGKELNIRNPKENKRIKEFFMDSMKVEIKSLLVVPVIDVSGQIVGVVEGVNKKTMDGFTEEDQSLIRSFASFAGLALEQWISNRTRGFDTSDVGLVESLSPSELTSIEVPERLKIFGPNSELISSIKFDVLDFQRNDGYKVLIHFFDRLELMSTFNISIGDLNQKFTKLELLVLLVVGICHNVGHSGNTHLSKEKTQVPLNILYKDQPILETIHCTSIIDILAHPNCNILAALNEEDLHEFWTMLIDCILSLDKSQYNKMIDEIQTKIESDDKFDLEIQTNRIILMKLLLNSSVNSNLFRPFTVGNPWAQYLCEDAVSNGPNEAMISENEIAKRQVEYIEKYCMPLFTNLVKIVPELQSISEQLRINIQQWQKLIG